MTLQELAEKEYPIYKTGAIHICFEDLQMERRTSFLDGLQLGMEFAEWIGKRDGTLYEDGWLITDDLNEKFKTTEELLSIFLKQKHESRT